MRVRDILRREKDVDRLDIIALLSSVLSRSTEKVLIQTDYELLPHEEDRLALLLGERREGKPVAYIRGEKEFFSTRFFVDPHVLIPRPETESLVEEALAIIKDVPKNWRIADVGTGSGAIGISLAKQTGYAVTCLDISPDALRVARKNISDLGLTGRLDLICSDLLSGLRRSALFDMVIANLPYISTAEWSALMPDVRLFEPKTALWGGDDGLDVYRRFLSDLTGHLTDGAFVLCEIGSTEQAVTLSHLLSKKGFSTRITKDLCGRDRVVVGSCRNSL